MTKIVPWLGSGMNLTCFHYSPKFVISFSSSDAAL